MSNNSFDSEVSTTKNSFSRKVYVPILILAIIFTGGVGLAFLNQKTLETNQSKIVKTGQSTSDGSNGQSGSNGTSGTSGNSGSNGGNGKAGTDGKSTNGQSGSNGTAGGNGSAGANGTGTKGDKGDTGIQGSNGQDGAAGASGSQGIQGVQGLTGATGSTGNTGAVGTQGIQGTSGVLSTTNDSNITGTVSGSNLTLGFNGQLPVSRGGTGLSSVANNSLLVGSGTNTLNTLAAGTTGQVLSINPSGTVTWQNTTTGFADPLTTSGDLIYRNGANTTARLGTGTAGQVLTVAGGLPTWSTDTATLNSSSVIGAANTGIFFYNNGTLSQDTADFNYDATTKKLTVTGGIDPLYFQAKDISGGNAAYYEAYAGQSAAVSAASTGKLIFNSTANKWQISENGGAYTNLLSGTSPVASVFGRSGAITAQNGDYTTSLVTEGTNLYYTDTRARGALSISGSPLTYNSTTGVLGISQANTTTSGYLSATDFNTFNNKLGSTLASGKLLVGNATNNAAPISLSGEGTIDNTGAFTLGSTIAGNKTFSGNGSIGGTLGVTGATTLSTLNTSGLATLNSETVTGNSTIGGNSSITGTLGVTGISTLASLVNTGSETMNGIAAPVVSTAGTGRIYFDSTSNTFKVSQNAGAYANLRTGSATNTLTSAVNTLTSTVDGTAATANLINTIANNSTTNTLTTTVNGVAGTGVSIINSSTVSTTGNNLTSTVNGVASSTAPIINTNTLTSTVNTLSGSVNGINATGVNIINSNTVSTSANLLTSTVNGIASATAPIINTNTFTQNGTNQIISTINGVASTPLTLAGFVDLTTAQTIAGNKTFSGNTAVGGTLGVTGNQTNAGSLSVGATLAVTGASTLTGNTTVAGTTTLQNALTVTGAAAFKKGTDYSIIGTTNDVVFGNASLVRLTGAATQIITGIAAGSDGQILTLINAGTNAATISNANTGSLAANRITTGTGQDLGLASNASTIFVYDSGSSLWRVIGGTGSGSAGYSSVDITDKATGGSIGTAATTVDTATNFNINQTTTGQTLTLPNPGNVTATKGKVITINNVGTANFTIGGITVIASTYANAYVWNGTLWQPINAASNVAADNGENNGMTNGQTSPSYPSYGNISGGSFTLPSAGTWEVDYAISANGSSTNVYLEVVNSSNVRVPNSTAVATLTGSNAVVSQIMRITTTGAATYRIRWATDFSTATLSNNSNYASKIGWKKISGNAPVSGQSADYVQAKLSANTASIGSGNDIAFNTTVSGNIPNASGVFTLTAGKTYKLDAVLRTINNSAANTILEYAWVDATSNNPLTNGNGGRAVNTDSSSGTSASGFAPAVIIYTPTTNQTVKVRTTFSANGNAQVEAATTYASIEQLGSSAVIAGSATPFNTITAATGTSSIDNTNFGQTWNWSTLTTGTGLTTSASAITTGSVIDIATGNASLNSNNGLFAVRNVGSSTSGLLAKFQSNSTAGSGLNILTNGNVGIGTATPGVKLELAGDGTTTFANSGLVLNNNGTSGRKFGVSSRNDSGNGSRFSISDETAGAERLTLSSAGTLNLNNASGSALIFGYAMASNQINAYSGQDAMTLKGNGTNNVLNMYSPQSVGTASMIIFVTDNGTVGSTKGSITSTGPTTSYNTTSDSRLKSNQRTTAFTLDDLMKVQVKDYTIGGMDNQTGFIAQQLDTVYPQAVTVGGSDPLKNPWTVDYGKVTPLLAKSIQDLNTKLDNGLSANTAKLDTLEQKTTTLETKTTDLNSRLTALETKTIATTPVPTPAGTSTFDGGIVTKDTTFQGTLTLDKTITVNGMAKFLSSTEFQDVLVNNNLKVKGNVDIDGTLAVGSDTAGEIKILAGQTTTKVKFSKAYSFKPIITVSNDDSEIAYKVINKTATGFEIVLTTPLTFDTDFSWIALGK